MHASLAERAVVRDEAASDVIGDRPNDSAHDLDAQAGRAADECLRALTREDRGDLAALVRGQGDLHVRRCIPFEPVPRIKGLDPLWAAPPDYNRIDADRAPANRYCGPRRVSRRGEAKWGGSVRSGFSSLTPAEFCDLFPSRFSDHGRLWAASSVGRVADS